MACDISKGRLVPCKNAGGLKAIHFINFNSALYEDLELDATTEEVTGFSSSNISLYKYELRGANNMIETGETNGDNNSAFWTGTGALQLASQNAVTRKEVKLMAYGRPHVITEGWDGVFKLYGAQNGCNVAVNTDSGTNLGDFNGYSVNITCSEKEPAFIVSSAIIGDTFESTIVVGV